MIQVKPCGFMLGPLPNFKPILKKWCEIVISWSERSEWEDVPWWYGERSSLGLFGLADWEVGATPLEEYSTKKGMGKGRYTGRGDLLILLEKTDYIIEAKQKWISISRRATKGQTKLEDAILDARESAKDTTGFRGKRAGLVFAVPYLSQNEEEFVDDQVSEFIQSLQDRDDSAVAWKEKRGFGVRHK